MVAQQTLTLLVGVRIPFPYSEVFIFGVWLSLVERYVRDVEVASSNLVTPIFLYPYRESLLIRFPVFFCCQDALPFFFRRKYNFINKSFRLDYKKRRM